MHLMQNSIVLIALLSLTACLPSNHPYPDEKSDGNVLYSAFTERPKHLDPARAYSSNEYIFLGQIVEPPLQYDYYKRPYTLQPLTAESIPTPKFIMLEGAQRVAYDITIKPGSYYSPHPAFNNHKRELIARDYVYQLERMATPKIQSPLYPLLSEHIVGFSAFSKPQHNEKLPTIFGVQLLDRYRYRIVLKNPYPQFIYWLALPFFAPMPEEVIAWHESDDRGTSHAGIDWHPIGTGAYALIKNDPNQEMILERNPNYRKVYDKKTQGFMPHIDRIVFKLEPETIPYWQKFLQGYFDSSGVGSDQFDSAIRITSDGSFERGTALVEKDIQLKKSPQPSIFYMGFNMLDDKVGGQSDKTRALRQAIAIAVDYEEMVSIFTNGRGSVAHSPIPPGIFGHVSGQEGINPITHKWIDNQAVRRPIEEAKELLSQAGYAEGIDPSTGKPLVLYFDTASTGPDSRPRLGWLTKQFLKLDINLVIRSTDYNRFQEKIRTSNAQIFEWGWNADYPDPENFFFLLYGPNGKVKHHGVNGVNFDNPQFDRLFEKMRLLPNGAQRQAVIQQMVDIVRHESPWLWGFNPLGVALYHKWVSNVYPNAMAHNTLQYRKLDTQLRQQKRHQWNQPKLLPLWITLFILSILVTYSIVRYRQRQNAVINRD